VIGVNVDFSTILMDRSKSSLLTTCTNRSKPVGSDTVMVGATNHCPLVRAPVQEEIPPAPTRKTKSTACSIEDISSSLRFTILLGLTPTCIRGRECWVQGRSGTHAGTGKFPTPVRDPLLVGAKKTPHRFGHRMSPSFAC